MNLSKSILRRLLSCLFALALLVVSFPASAFALETGVQLSRKNFAFDGENFTTGGPDTDATAKLGGNYSGNNWKVSEDNTADLWIYSTDMVSAGEADGSTVPYVIDGAGQKWVLKEIAIANYKTIGGNGEYNGFKVVMTSDQIEAATTKENYIIDTTDLNITSYPLRPDIPYYYVWYGWELADAVEGLKQYNISYDLNLPTGDIPENSMSLYPVLTAGSVDAGDSNGSLKAVKDYATKLGASVYSNQNYTVSDFNSVHDGAEYTDFLVFNYNSNSDYYTFDGWTVKDKGDTVYTIGQELNPDDMAALADGSNDITFVGKWSKIEPMTDDQLQDASAKLTLNALVGVDSQPLIMQSVNGKTATSNPVTLTADDTISYTVEAKLGSDIIGSSDGQGMSVQEGFAQFTYQVKVDSNLEFTHLNDDGMVTLTFTAQKFKPTQTNIEGATIIGDSGTWTITFDPENVPEEDGSQYIEVTMESMFSSLSDIGGPITLSGLDFKAKADQYGVVPKIETSANVVGSMDLHKKTQLRGYYQTVNFFMSYPDWKNHFDATADTPTAVAHASQFIDYELEEIDLAKDKAGLEANTVVANSEDDKISYPALDKKVQTDTSDDQPIWGDATTAAANDMVSFQLNSNVPQDLLNYITPDEADPPAVLSTLDSVPAETVRGSYPLVIHDQMDAAFTMKGEPQVVLDREGTDNDYTLTSDQYTYTTETGDDCTFHIVIDLAKLYASNVINNDDIQNVTPITVTYTATLASDVAAGKYLNTAWVTYPGEGESEHSTVSVTTYGINIFKYDQAKGVDDADAGLAGAEFKIYGSDAVDEDGNLKADATPIRENAVVSGDDGHVIIDGLNVGTYYLVETKAPTGYVKSDKPLEVIIPDKVDETTYRAAVNFANSLVPHTGGTGTVMYTVGGLAIIVLAGILLVVYRKSRKKQDR